MKKILNILKSFTDKKCLKKELKYVFYNCKEKHLVAINTKELLIIEYDLKVENNLLIDVNNINNSNNGIIIGSYTAYKEYNIGIFPKYSKLLDIKNNKTNIIDNKLSFIECLINTCFITKKEFYIAYKSFYSKINLKQKNTIILFNNDKEPFIIKGDVNYGSKKESKFLNTKLIVMPMSIK